MILKIIRWLRGYVTFEIIGRFPERFINLSVRQGFFIFSAKPFTDRFIASLLISDYRHIRYIARKSSVRLRICERHGFPFLLRRYRRRAGLMVGLLLFLVITLSMQGFVWSIDINGINTISESHLIEILNEKGLFCGARKGTIDIGALQRSVMTDIKEIGWMSVNIIGTKAEVEIKEKELKPHILEADVPCNVKADMDGRIISMNTKYGKAVVSPGSAVIKGSLLVSGVLENPSGDVSFVHADAQVIAQTQRAVSFSLNRKGITQVPQSTVNRYKLMFFQMEIPLKLASVRGDTTSRIQRDNLQLNKTNIPFGIISECCTSYLSVNYEINKENARKALKFDDYLYRLFSLSDCESILAQANIQETPSEFTCHMLYECTEDIAVEENFIVN